MLSAEAFRNRVGIAVRNGKIEYTHEEPYVLTALQRITDDLAHKRIVLGDIWDFRGKLAYLDKLDTEGVLPTSTNKLQESTENKKLVRQQTIRARPSSGAVIRSRRRSTLIPNTPFPITWTGNLQRHHEIWDELQFRLRLNEHPNAIAVLLRVIIELSIENYISKNNLATICRNDKLPLRAKKVAEDLLEKEKIDEKYFGIIKKFQQNELMISADTLNRYIHSSQFSPSPEHLTAIWDSLADLIVHCLNA